MPSINTVSVLRLRGSIRQPPPVPQCWVCSGEVQESCAASLWLWNPPCIAQGCPPALWLGSPFECSLKFGNSCVKALVLWQGGSTGILPLSSWVGVCSGSNFVTSFCKSEVTAPAPYQKWVLQLVLICMNWGLSCLGVWLWALKILAEVEKVQL